MTTSAERPTRLVLDAGPLIGFLYVKDGNHVEAARGFHQLAQSNTRLIAPLPIVFEVYKWLMQKSDPSVAYLGLQRMQESLQILYPGESDFAEAIRVLVAMPMWRGTLEDALVAITGLKLDVPVWTLNYRDFAAFRNLRFWTPDPS